MRHLLLLIVIFVIFMVAFKGKPRAEPISTRPIIALEEQRYCGAPRRATDGSIYRRSDTIAAFKKSHPCPVNGHTTGACPGWAIDHVIPLACGGCDAVSNMQWLPNSLKSTTTGKDRFERKIYCTPFQVVN
jgi:hypothetical protein